MVRKASQEAPTLNRESNLIMLGLDYVGIENCAPSRTPAEGQR